MAGARGHCRQASPSGDRSRESRRVLAVCARGFRKASRFCLCRDSLREGECLHASFERPTAIFQNLSSLASGFERAGGTYVRKRDMSEGGIGRR